MYNQVWYNLITVIAMGVHFELDKYIKYHWLNIQIFKYSASDILYICLIQNVHPMLLQ